MLFSLYPWFVDWTHIQSIQNIAILYYDLCVHINCLAANLRPCEQIQVRKPQIFDTTNINHFTLNYLDIDLYVTVYTQIL